MIFDTHAHYDDEAFDADRDAVLSMLASAGIGHVVNNSYDLNSSKKSLELAAAYPFIHAAAGLHPDNVANLPEDALNRLEKLARNPKCVAIGEIGLDYHGFDLYADKPSKELQQTWFKEQLRLAARLNKPVVIHSRNAAEDTLNTMQWAKEELGIQKAIIHCFSYSREIALSYLNLGYLLGFGGSVTYEGQKKISKVLTAVPLESIVLETDCPYLTPLPKRGERNDSRNLPLVIAKIAEIKSLSPESIERATWDTACRFFGIEARCEK